MRVFVTHNTEDREAYFAKALVELERVVTVVVNPLDRDLTTSELIEAAQECQVVIAHRSTPGDAALFNACPELLAFLRCAVDISTIDLSAASNAGVLVARADKSFVASTAELALGLLLALLRNVGESVVDYRTGAEPSQRSGRQLAGKTVGLIGYGSIARHLAPVLQALGTRVIVADPYEDSLPDGFDRVSLRTLLADSHIVMPLAVSNAETVGLIGSVELAAMRTGALLVNVSRGELVDEDAVEAALRSGHLGGLAMDVGSAADQRPNKRLASLPGVVATPHLGGLTPENADAQAMSAVEQVASMQRGDMPMRAVNEVDARRLRAWWRSAR